KMEYWYHQFSRPCPLGLTQCLALWVRIFIGINTAFITHHGKFVLTAKPINHGPVDALTVGTVADPTMRVVVGRATVPASQIE
nr:hypothetical protein [Desulfobacteraceae bacterium]